MCPGVHPSQGHPDSFFAGAVPEEAAGRQTGDGEPPSTPDTVHMSQVREPGRREHLRSICIQVAFVLPSLCPPYIPQRLHRAQRRFVTSDGLLPLGILGGHKAAVLREWSPLSAQLGLVLAEDSSGGKWGAGPAPGAAPGQEDRQPGRDRPLAISGPWTYFVLV